MEFLPVAEITGFHTFYLKRAKQVEQHFPFAFFVNDVRKAQIQCLIFERVRLNLNLNQSVRFAFELRRFRSAC